MGKMKESAAYIQLAREIKTYFRSIGAEDHKIEEWWDLGSHEDFPRTLSTLKKILANKPTKEKFQEWCRQPKGQLSSLQGEKAVNGGGVRYPILCGWSQDQVIQALSSSIYDLVNKYVTLRCDKDDCYQYGCIGVIHALRTDAGISAFASHAYSRIRTSIRRNSVTSGVIKEPEKKPSRTEVRREITTWLLGAHLNLFRDDLAQKHVEEHHSTIDLNRDKNGKLLQGSTAYEVSTKEFAEVGQSSYYNKIESKKLKQEIDKKAKKKLSELERRVPINRKRLLNNPSHLSKYKLQKTGHQSYIEIHISERFELTHLDTEVLMDLLSYLDYKFGSMNRTSGDHRPSASLFQHFDSARFKIIGDIILHVSTAPDFHGNPMSLTGMTDDGHALSESLADHNSIDPVMKFLNGINKDNAKRLLEAMRSKLVLTNTQDVVFRYTHGLDGVEPMDGADIARQFGRLLKEEPVMENGTETFRTISRERVSQYQKNINKKLVVAMFDTLLEGKSAKQVQTMLEEAVDKADMPPKQRLLVCQHHGLKGAPKHDVKTLATRYEDIIGDPLGLSPKLSENQWQRAAEKIVHTQLSDAKQKLVLAAL